MTTSSIPAVITYLVGAVTAALPGAHVFDGPPGSETALTLDDRVWIGYSPIDPELPAAAGDQEFAALGARSRNEQYAIVCAIEHWSGDAAAFADLRSGAFSLLAGVEMLLRGAGGHPGDCTLGGNVLYAQIAGGIEVRQATTPNGASVLIQFHISARARLTTS